MVAEETNTAIDNLPPLTRLRCQVPRVEKFNGKNIMYYPHMDYDERTPPTRAEAELMCRTSGRKCPLAAQCLKLGLALEADHGVWGGKTLVDGKVYNTKTEEK